MMKPLEVVLVLGDEVSAIRRFWVDAFGFVMVGFCFACGFDFAFGADWEVE